MTSLPTDAAELAKYYYVIADASEEKLLQLVDAKSEQNAKGKAMEYVAVNDPLQNFADLWILEHDTQGYHIRNMADSYYPLQTEWNAGKYRRTNDQIYPCQWTKVNITKTDTGWQIENGKYTGGYFGYWDKTKNQNEVASDKTGDNIGNYTIYAIERAKCLENYASGKDLSAGLDVTAFLINPTVKGKNTKGSEDVTPVEKVLGYTISTTNCNPPYNKNANKCEFWGETASTISFEMSQTVYVPNGKYTLTASMYNSSNGVTGDAPNGNMGAFANEKFVGIATDGTSLTPYTVDVTVTDGILKFGYKTNGIPGARWFVGGGFTLKYYGEDLTAYTDALSTAITTAEGITPSANKAANAALTVAIATAKAIDTTNKDDVIAGTTALNNAIAAYNAAVIAYPSYTDMEKYAEDMLAAMTVVEDADKTTFSDAITAQKTAIAETATDAAAIKACEDALVAACKVYVGKASPAADQIFDITRLYLVNPDLTGLATWKTCDGWYSDLATGQVMQNGQVKGSTDKDYFFEIYTGNAGGFAKGNGVYQKATLPAGTYKMEAYGFSRAANNVSGTGDGYISAFANETLGAPTLANTMTEITTAFILDAEGEAKMGLYIADGNKGNWAGCGYMKLYKYNTNALAVAKAAYDEAKTAAEQVNGSKMSKAVKDALETAINATPGETAESYQTATSALVEATNNANASVIVYASLKTALDKYPVRSEFSGVEFTSRNVADAAYESGSYTDGEAKTKASELLNDYRQYLRDIVKNYKTATAFVVDATYKDGDDTSHPGWTNIDNAQNKGVSGVQDSDDGTGKYMENWQSSLNVGDIKQTVTNLPAGKYFLKMSAHTRKAGDNDYIYIKSGDKESHGAILIPGKPSITITDPIDVTDGTAEIGLHVGSGSDWASWNYVELYAYSVDDQTRTVPADKYGTVCLPYNATVEGATLYDATVNDAKNEVTLTAVNGNTVEAGKAYIYQATAAEQTFKFVDDANMVKDPTAGTLTGVFAKQEAAEGTYVLQMDEDGTTQKFFRVADVKPTLNAYRAYLTVPTESAAKALTISFGNPTAVDAVKALTEGDAVIYDLTGKRLSKLQRGINIVNGVKVVVK